MTELDKIYKLLRYQLIPNMRKLFILKNPVEYYRWGGNCCRQAAMMTAYAFYKSGYCQNDIYLIERTFNGFIKKSKTPTGTFIHCFNSIWIKDDKRYLTVDMSTQNEEPIWYMGFPDENRGVYSYPVHRRTKLNMATVPGTTRTVDWKSYTEKGSKLEYYTNLPMVDIYDICLSSSEK